MGVKGNQSRLEQVGKLKKIKLIEYVMKISIFTWDNLGLSKFT